MSHGQETASSGSNSASNQLCMTASWVTVSCSPQCPGPHQEHEVWQLPSANPFQLFDLAEPVKERGESQMCFWVLAFPIISRVAFVCVIKPFCTISFIANNMVVYNHIT